MTKYTAIVRKRLSLPTAYLLNKGYIRGEVLDYGCGRGFDMKELNIDGYDPNWFPYDYGDKKYDTILCNYVLNVVNDKEINEILLSIYYSLKESGVAFFTVRRDLTGDTLGRGCIQRLIYLNECMSIYKNSKFEIYAASRKNIKNELAFRSL